MLALVARGLNNTEIAEALGLSPLTAKTHVSRIMGKLGARDRAQLVIVAYESGLVTPGAGPSGPGGDGPAGEWRKGAGHLGMPREHGIAVRAPRGDDPSPELLSPPAPSCRSCTDTHVHATSDVHSARESDDAPEPHPARRDHPRGPDRTGTGIGTASPRRRPRRPPGASCTSSVPYVAGQDGYDTYRIPATVTTGKGTLLAFAEGRHDGAGDSGNIDVVLRRSTDGGCTWGPLSVVARRGR